MHIGGVAVVEVAVAEVVVLEVVAVEEEVVVVDFMVEAEDTMVVEVTATALFQKVLR